MCWSGALQGVPGVAPKVLFAGELEYEEGMDALLVPAAGKEVSLPAAAKVLVPTLMMSAMSIPHS